MIQEGAGTSVNTEVKSESPVAEAPEVKETPVDEPKGLSRRDAIEVAVTALKEEPKAKEPKAKKIVEPVKEAPKFEPPSEYTREEREDFLSLTPKQQEASLRLHKSRLKTIEEIKRERAELDREKIEHGHVRELGKQLEPLLKSRGAKESAYSLLAKAAQMVNEVDANPRQAILDLIKLRKLDVSDDLLKQLKGDDPIDSKFSQELSDLRKEVNDVKSEKEALRLQHTNNQILAAWDRLGSQKNAAGKPRFPDLFDESEKGLRLASDVGSLVRNQHPHSAAFYQYLQARIPNPDDQRVLEEAYRWFNGAVDDSLEVPRTQNSKQHVAKMSRAIASTPGNSVPVEQPITKKLSRREAIALAYQQAKEREAEGT